MSDTVIQLKSALSYFEAGRLEEARALCELALCENPRDEIALELLVMIDSVAGEAAISEALALNQAGENGQAITILNDLLETRPDDAQIFCALGSAYFHLKQFNKSRIFLERALKLDPNVAEAYAVLGNCRINQGDVYGALEAFEKSHQISRFNPAVFSSYLFYMAFHPDYDGARLSHENQAWGKFYADGLNPFMHDVPAPARPNRLRIGYLSYEYATHVTSFYFEPLVSRHDRNRFEVFCYAGNEKKDDTTDRLSGYVDHWIDISSLDAKAVARRIKEDNIHILISTSSYLAKHRLPMAYRPAPIQVCYHNRVATTGLVAVDYLITEELVDPTGETDDLYTEKLVRLTHRCCYSAPTAGPAPGAPPVRENGYITFGSFNNTAKIGPDVVSAWAALLGTVENSRLLVKNIVRSEDDDDWKFLRRMFETGGVDLERVCFLPYVKTRNEHLAAYRHVDIMLDTYPFTGGTTCCDALWMGVPVVAKVGKTFCRCQAGEYLTKVGLADLICGDWKAYNATALSLARDTERLSELRVTLRPLMQEKMLDYDLHAIEMMTAYDQMWSVFAEGRPVESFNVNGSQVDQPAPHRSQTNRLVASEVSLPIMPSDGRPK